MPTEIAFKVPTSIAEAVEHLSVEGSMLVGGGTSVSLLMKNRLIEPTNLVYLGRIAELSGISLNNHGDLVIGATTTLRELEFSTLIGEHEPVLQKAASQVGNPRVRAIATLGGALAHGDARQDIPPVLMALNAHLRVVGPKGERTTPLDSFFQGLMEIDLAEDEMIIEVLIPQIENRVIVYSRFAPGSEDDFPTVGVAAALVKDADGVVTAARIALGGVASYVKLAIDAAQLIEGRNPTADDIEAAATAAAAATDPADDQRGSAEYKTAMTKVWVKRTLQQCLGVAN